MGSRAVRRRQEIFRSIKPGPRAQMAARLYASGAVPSKRAACEAVGLSPNYLTVLDSAGNEVTGRIEDEVQRAISDETVSLSRVIALMSRKAAKRMGELVDSQNEHVAVKASSDLLDRNPESSKTFKASITSFSLDKMDVKELAASLVAAARLKEKFSSVAAGDFVKVEVETDATPGNGSKGSKGNLVSSEAAEPTIGVAGISEAREAAQGTEEGTKLLKE